MYVCAYPWRSGELAKSSKLDWNRKALCPFFSGSRTLPLPMFRCDTYDCCYGNGPCLLGCKGPMGCLGCCSREGRSRWGCDPGERHCVNFVGEPRRSVLVCVFAVFVFVVVVVVSTVWMWLLTVWPDFDRRVVIAEPRFVLSWSSRSGRRCRRCRQSIVGRSRACVRAFARLPASLQASRGRLPACPVCDVCFQIQAKSQPISQQGDRLDPQTVALGRPFSLRAQLSPVAKAYKYCTLTHPFITTSSPPSSSFCLSTLKSLICVNLPLF